MQFSIQSKATYKKLVRGKLVYGIDLRPRRTAKIKSCVGLFALNVGKEKIIQYKSANVIQVFQVLQSVHFKITELPSWPSKKDASILYLEL
ncbi:MAG: hypothetical protein ABIV51_04500 [Saprospiraceae bacterium]